jgi:hypothetical protein
MTTSASLTPWPTIWTIVGVLLSLAITVSTAAGLKLPLITDDRLAVLALVIVGFAMCMAGGSARAIGGYGMTHPVTILGSLIGVLALLIGASVLFSFRLPLIADNRTALFVLAGIILLKVVMNGALYLLGR